jgi:hypothetical protein
VGGLSRDFSVAVAAGKFKNISFGGADYLHADSLA